MNEQAGDAYPLVIDKLKESMKTAITEHAAFTINKRTKVKGLTSSDLLASSLSKDAIKLDRQLYKIARGLNTLSYINPTNLKQEKRRFLSKPHTYVPQFTYRQLDLDPYKFREQLYRLPVEDIRDAGVQKMYRRVIDQLAVRIDLCALLVLMSFFTTRFATMASQMSVILRMLSLFFTLANMHSKKKQRSMQQGRYKHLRKLLQIMVYLVRS